jgi:hypothetical protein
MPITLPARDGAGAWSVALTEPLHEGVPAHRAGWKSVPRNPRYPAAGSDFVPEALCQPDRKAFPVSAAWADHCGATACQHPNCFGKADNEPHPPEDEIQ